MADELVSAFQFSRRDARDVTDQPSLTVTVTLHHRPLRLHREARCRLVNITKQLIVRNVYHSSLALLTDMYQLTMAYGYWKLKRYDRPATFHLYFRQLPFEGGFTIAAGLQTAVEFLRDLKFQTEDINYLAELQGSDGLPIFDADFLQFLAEFQFACDVDAIPEGTVVFADEPLLRVTGPIGQCQIVESPLLNILNFQTLIATKAARVCQASEGQSVFEFGLRRAQGIDGSLAASRAAYIGGCAGTSNLLAGKHFGIPVKGTHAHSWVMSFDSELDAFQAYANAMPNNCLFLVDTYDTVQGISNAIKVGRQLRENGQRLLGIRLDSGDLAELSKTARSMLDEAGFEDAIIVACNELDESIIETLRQQGAQIAVWGVGTRMITAFNQPALGGVYKLGAIQDEHGQWQPKIKLSDQAVKTSHPGRLRVRRYYDGDVAAADMIYDELLGEPEPIVVHPLDPTRRQRLDPGWRSEELLQSVLAGGQLVHALPCIQEIRNRTLRQLNQFHAGINRRVNPHWFPVGLELQLYESKTKLILAARGFERP